MSHCSSIPLISTLKAPISLINASFFCFLARRGVRGDESKGGGDLSSAHSTASAHHSTWWQESFTCLGTRQDVLPLRRGIVINLEDDRKGKVRGLASLSVRVGIGDSKFAGSMAGSKAISGAIRRSSLVAHRGLVGNVSRHDGGATNQRKRRDAPFAPYRRPESTPTLETDLEREYTKTLT